MKKIALCLATGSIAVASLFMASSANGVKYSYECKWVEKPEVLEAGEESDFLAVCYETVYDGKRVISEKDYYPTELMVADGAAEVTPVADNHFNVVFKDQGTVTVSAVFEVSEDEEIMLTGDFSIE